MSLSLEETIKYLSEELEKNTLSFLDDEKIILQKCFDMIFQDVQILQQEKEPVENLKNRDNKTNIKLIQDTIYTLNEQFLNRGLSPNRITFIKSMLEFIFNWNSNILNDKIITNSCSILYQSLDLFQHLQKTIEILQKTLTTYQDLKSWLPPAFEISKTYLDELLKRNE